MKINLIAPPGVPLYLPSLGLTRLKGVIKEHFNPEDVSVNIDYLNYEFYSYFGHTFYMQMHNNNAMGYEETFRYSAFDLPHDINIMGRFFLNDNFFHNYQSMHEEIIKKIINLPVFIDEIIEKYNLTDYDLAGLTTGFSLTPALAFCKALKKKKPGIITMLGGSLVFRENGKAWIKYFPYVDYIASGPAMISFPELIKGLINKDEKKINSIKGIFTKTNYDHIDLYGDERDINTEPMLDYSDYSKAFYDNNMQEVFEPRLILETSKGCKWGRCRFCNHHKYDTDKQIQDYDITIKRINKLFEEYKGFSIHIIDSFIQIKTLEYILPEIKKDDNQSLFFHTRANINEKTIKLFADHGIYLFEPGLESLSTPILELMDKGNNSFQNLKLLKLCLKYGIIPSWNCLYGIPGMNDEHYEKMIVDVPSFYHLYPTFAFNIFFLRWSPFWEEPGKFNLNLIPHPLYNMLFPYQDEGFITDVAFAYHDITQHQTSVNALVEKYSERISAAFRGWIKKWDLNEAKEIPKLYFYTRDNSHYIYDSRYENTEEIQINEPLYSMLKTMDRQSTKTDIITKHSLSEKEIDKNLEYLLEKRFIFHENDRYLNLVLENNPAAFQDIYIQKSKNQQLFV